MFRHGLLTCIAAFGVWLALPALSAEPAPGATAAPATPVEASTAVSDDSGPVTTPLQAPQDAAKAVAHIALILPTRSRDFSRAADAVRAGFEVAHQIDPDKPLPVKLYGIDSEAREIAGVYSDAVARGAVCVVGGLTRDGAVALAYGASVAVATLAINAVEANQVPQAPFYSVNLSLETEAREVARYAQAEGVRRIGLIVGPSVAAKRSAEAFARQWQVYGNEIAGQWALTGDAARLAKVRDAAREQRFDGLFIAGENAAVRQARPYLPSSMPVYATSQANNARPGPANLDLEGLRFLDMPWLLDPAHPAVAIYPRPSQLVSADLERLYALGIDAYRLAALLARRGADRFSSLDGVTGHITLVDGWNFARELMPAQFSGGRALPIEQRAQ